MQTTVVYWLFSKRLTFTGTPAPLGLDGNGLTVTTIFLMSKLA
jgi:hypothetical protein